MYQCAFVYAQLMQTILKKIDFIKIMSILDNDLLNNLRDVMNNHLLCLVAYIS